MTLYLHAPVHFIFTIDVTYIRLLFAQKLNIQLKTANNFVLLTSSSLEINLASVSTTIQGSTFETLVGAISTLLVLHVFLLVHLLLQPRRFISSSRASTVLIYHQQSFAVGFL
jgi:hypothetical protein